MMGDSGDSHRGKKKKKRSFLQNQKRFAKRGSCGRGTRLSPDMYEYFLNIIKIMNSTKDETEMGILISNVFEELKGKEAEYCCNQIISRVVENLLPLSSDEEFCEFIGKFSENLRPLFSDTFGSHVLQQSLIVSYTKYKRLVESDNNLSTKFLDYILKISNFLFNNLEDFIWDPHSNAVGRTVFNVLSGNPVKGEIKLKLEFPDHSVQPTPEEFKVVLKKYASRILTWPQFNNLCNQTVNSAFLQSLLLALKNFSECIELVKRMIAYYENSPLDLTDAENEPFLRLLEVVLQVADEESFALIYNLMFKKQLFELAVSKNGNFAVQKLIMNCRDVKVFEKIFAKLASHIEDILKVEYSGVLLSLVRACRSLGVLQADCMTMLMNAFQAKDPKDLVPLVYSLTRSENFDLETSHITLHGCLVIQELLNFKKPIKVVNSILELPETKLVKLLSDVKGSHITDAFVGSATIGEKSRDKLFKKLKGHYLQLATSKHGSRSLDAIWSVIGMQQKVLLAEELKASQSELCADIYGRGFAGKIHLDNFRRDKDEWIKLQKTSETVGKYFADIIPAKRRKKS